MYTFLNLSQLVHRKRIRPNSDGNLIRTHILLFIILLFYRLIEKQLNISMKYY